VGLQALVLVYPSLAQSDFLRSVDSTGFAVLNQVIHLVD
jgi:hypothetical protein